MRRTIDYFTPDPTPLLDSDGEVLGATTWVVAVSDDYDDTGVRVMLTLEEVGRAGAGTSVHLAPDTARRLRTALRNALREVGEAPGE
jgi:hypothetical protein